MSQESSLAPSVDEAATSDGIKKQLDEIFRGLEDFHSCNKKFIQNTKQFF